VELGDGVGDCQEEDYNQESLFYSFEDIQGPHWAALGRGAWDFMERKRLKGVQLHLSWFLRNPRLARQGRRGCVRNRGRRSYDRHCLRPRLRMLVGGAAENKFVSQAKKGETLDHPVYRILLQLGPQSFFRSSLHTTAAYCLSTLQTPYSIFRGWDRNHMK